MARTGTTSLHQAMLQLGLRSAPSSVALLDGVDHEFIARHDTFFDNPVPFRYQVLDRAYPDSRWIVTQRPLEPWLDSMRWLFGPGLDRLDPATRALGDRVHRNVYGIDTFDADALRGVYTRHYDHLATWIIGRPHIWLHLEAGLRWEPICELLKLPQPKADFPHANAAT